MKFFSKPQIFDAMVFKSSGKMIKTGPSNKKPGIVASVRIPMTPAMMSQMPPRVQTLLAAGAEKIQDSLMLGKMEADYSARVSINIYSMVSGERLISRGGANGNPMMMKVKKFYNVGDTPCMEIELSGLYDVETWIFLGGCIGEGDCRVEVIPFEGELFPKDEEETEGNKEAAEKAQRN